MLRVWGKEFKDNRMLRDFVADNEVKDTYTNRVLSCLEEICVEFDLSKPVWFEKNIRDFQRASKTRFTADNFIDSIDFDYLELQVIEE